jgi:hypothetical protein
VEASAYILFIAPLMDMAVIAFDVSPAVTIATGGIEVFPFAIGIESEMPAAMALTFGAFVFGVGVIGRWREFGEMLEGIGVGMIHVGIHVNPLYKKSWLCYG